ncbi:MAG TPA: amylo-alpha-1,6-glucosidase [Candidatus Binataceae bacterium]|nr:amylo-alpha-1,6-glucosidase [Candidatus Binataceae bacterium]
MLVNGESFAVFDAAGDVLEMPQEPLGFFYRDTRYLSRFELRFAGETPYLLNSYASRENAQLRVNLSNPDLADARGTIKLARNSIQIERNWVIAGSALFHKIKLFNYFSRAIEVPLDLLLGVDFADIFHVRGVKRAARGGQLAPQVTADALIFGYEGRDGVQRFSKLIFEPAPVTLEADRASFVCTLQSDEAKELEVRVLVGSAEPAASVQVPRRFDAALTQRRRELDGLDAGWTRISASHESLDLLLQRSIADLTSMIRFAPEGSYLMAGIPWFATLFGRDSLLTALFVLPFNPALAVGTLKTLARLQGTTVDPQRDEQPGKIVHEIRGGELAAIGEVPFGRYYGSVDATPLFLWLLGRYVETSGDLTLAEELWPNACAALDWVERFGDRDGDGYVEYFCETAHGLVNQGWKDSADAIMHADGTLARSPIALCEVQGYVYAAYEAGAMLARRLNHADRAERMEQRAAALRASFANDFWLDSVGTVALALDSQKRPCGVMASNAGHCLATGLLNHQQAAVVADRLMGEDMFSGWGVRTLSARERRYNPMSYHNGSVWPHDNALLASGLGRYQRRQDAMRILNGLVQAAGQFKTGSLPELFCGFTRDERLGPVPYPVACHPQAWSAASVFMILQAVLGLEVRGFEQKLVIDSPALPDWLDWLRIERLKVGNGEVSLIIRRMPEGPAIGVLERHRAVSVEVVR